MNVGISLKVCLAKREINQTELAQELGLSRAAVNRYAKKKTASTRSIERFAKHFGLSTSEFIKLGED